MSALPPKADIGTGPYQLRRSLCSLLIAILLTFAIVMTVVMLAAMLLAHVL
jgi:hypothetical protein